MPCLRNLETIKVSLQKLGEALKEYHPPNFLPVEFWGEWSADFKAAHSIVSKSLFDVAGAGHLLPPNMPAVMK